MSSSASTCDGLSPEIAIKIERADGIKCERCRKYTTDTGFDPQFSTICAACADAVKETLHA
jgi:isoleucyl-tRNA synthetase